ncbi:EpsG-like putative glucosyltransferase [Flavobacterium tiangeerense]|uniref:EpsG-like putative glucosyltransferase n=1 Tax=Flavobacterium tiangeerense TaxID=459471 RepID=A0ABY3FJQ6_9FLAO|nr:EpsG family protein [Flavobacterium tiangeerense]TWH99147.1 EpsG-like putative glucosyltransferase [Flavobacterium tiangeerense]
MKQRIDLFNLVLFIVSPFLSIPSIIYGIVKRSKISLALLAFLFGIVSYLYIPNYSNDKTRYFEIYEMYKYSSFLELFYFYYAQNQDFIFQSMIFFASKMGINAQFVFAIVGIITMGILVFIFSKLYENIPKKFSLVVLVLFLFSLPYTDMLSGIRFMFAVAFVLLAFYQGIILNKKASYIFLILAIFIHFSTLIYIPIFFLLKYFPNKTKLYKIFFFVSFLFFIIPKSFIFSFFDSIGFQNGLQTKGSAYLEGDDFLSNTLSIGSTFTLFVFYFTLIVIFTIYAYLVIYKSDSVFRSIILLLAASMNVFYSVPTIFFRYGLVLVLFFIFLFIYELSVENKKKTLYFFCFLFSINLFINIIYTKDNIVKSIVNADSLFLITILDKEYINFMELID